MQKKGSKNHHPALPRKLTFSQRASDSLTKYVGSWAFIIGVVIFMGLWMGINVYWLVHKSWDPYPFILLNFVLSCLAALQAPIILMSQNREAERDRNMAKYDYQVNRKAEREITGMQKDLDEIKNLFTVGRRGLFLHCNIDHCISQSLELADLILSNKWQDKNLWRQKVSNFLKFSARD